MEIKEIADEYGIDMKNVQAAFTFCSICTAVAQNYSTMALAEYISGKELPECFAIMRLDIDRRAGNALDTAREEVDEHRIRATNIFIGSRLNTYILDIKNRWLKNNSVIIMELYLSGKIYVYNRNWSH